MKAKKWLNARQIPLYSAAGPHGHKHIIVYYIGAASDYRPHGIFSQSTRLTLLLEGIFATVKARAANVLLSAIVRAHDVELRYTHHHSSAIVVDERI